MSIKASIFSFHVNPLLISLAGWSAERVQEYFVWAAEVVKGLKGTNSALEEKLEDQFKQRGVQL